MSRSSWSRQLKIVSLVILSVVLLSPAASAGDEKSEAAASASRLYEVKDGNKVDAATLQGWKTWRALACERCHGAAQEGMVGPSLIESMKRLSKEQFHDRLMKGSPEKGMPPFSGSEMVNKNWEGLYAYLKGRSDGAITRARVEAMGDPATGMGAGK